MSDEAVILTDLALLLVRLVLGGLFVSSAWGKIKQPQYFATAVDEYRILPRCLVRPFSLSLPWVEGIAGAALVLGWQTQVAASLARFLLAVFAFAVAVNLLRGRTDLECGCFGADARRPIHWKLVLRNIMLALLSSALIWNAGGPMSLDHWLSSPAASRTIMLLGEAAPPMALAGAGALLLVSLVRRLVLILQRGDSL